MRSPLDPHLTKIEEHKSKTDGICRSYRESALAEALLHAWRDAEDTRMRSAPFRKSQKQTSSLRCRGVKKDAVEVTRSARDICGDDELESLWLATRISRSRIK